MFDHQPNDMAISHQSLSEIAIGENDHLNAGSSAPWLFNTSNPHLRKMKSLMSSSRPKIALASYRIEQDEGVTAHDFVVLASGMGFCEITFLSRRTGNVMQIRVHKNSSVYYRTQPSSEVY